MFRPCSRGASVIYLFCETNDTYGLSVFRLAVIKTFFKSRCMCPFFKSFLLRYFEHYPANPQRAVIAGYGELSIVLLVVMFAWSPCELSDCLGEDGTGYGVSIVCWQDARTDAVHSKGAYILMGNAGGGDDSIWKGKRKEVGICWEGRLVGDSVV